MVLKIDYGTVKLQKVTYDAILLRQKNTSSKIRHYNDVTEIFHFQALPLAKS